MNEWLDVIFCFTRAQLLIFAGLVTVAGFVIGWGVAAMCASAKWGDSWNK